MDNPFPTPWHKESYDRFLNDGLPERLAKRLPLDYYGVVNTGTDSCRVEFSLTGDASSRFTYDDLPRPDADGVFTIETPAETPEDSRRVVVPTASGEDLEAAEIVCVGE